MTNKTSKRRSGFRISILLYIFSGLILISAIFSLFFTFSTARSISGNDIFFQLAGIGEIAQVIVRPLQAALINTGIILFIFLLIFAGLLFAIGQLLDRQANLIGPIKEIEDKLEISNHKDQVLHA